MFDHYERYDYFKCTDCGGIFIHPMPDIETISSFYPANYSVFDVESHIKKVSPLKQAILRHNNGYNHLSPSLHYRLAAAILAPFYRLATPDYIPNGILLDVGCGNGRYLSTMRSLGWNVQGVELSENGIKVCKASQLDVHHGDLVSANFADNSFDLITVRHVIEHIRDPRAFMAELARILKPSGRLVIETPNSNALGRSFMGANWYANDVPRHLILFSAENLGLLASAYGLRQSHVWLETTPKIILNSIDYAIGNNTGKASNKIGWRRLASRLYIWLTRYSKRGDTIHSDFSK
jgi:2-polyprenyl-3-methyl-5-hydroxy-6-metoxy-1,4-benzoquinol methylase